MAPPGLQRLLAGYLPINLLQAAVTLGAVMVFSRLLGWYLGRPIR